MFPNQGRDIYKSVNKGYKMILDNFSSSSRNNLYTTDQKYVLKLNINIGEALYSKEPISRKSSWDRKTPSQFYASRWFTLFELIVQPLIKLKNCSNYDVISNAYLFFEIKTWFLSPYRRKCQCRCNFLVYPTVIKIQQRN